MSLNIPKKYNVEVATYILWLDIYYGLIYIDMYIVEVAGSTAVVVGRSKIVGTPVAGESRHHCRWFFV